MSFSVREVVAAIESPKIASRSLRRDQQAQIETASASELTELYNGLRELDPRVLGESSLIILDKLLQVALVRMVQLAQEDTSAIKKCFEPMEKLYVHLGPSTGPRARLLETLTRLGTSDSLAAFMKWIREDPPADDKYLDFAFVPLFERPSAEVAGLFPQLLDRLDQEGMATIILDLANFLTRNDVVESHPASDRAAALRELLGGLVQELEQIHESKTPDPAQLEETAMRVAQGVSLGVSLCDALALIGDKAAIGKLNQAAEVPHRRLKIEALAALARLGDEVAKERLLSSAADPVTRLRTLEYARELGCEEEVDEAFRTQAARAESELAIWLAEPTQLGLAPSRLQVIDKRDLGWPGYEKPVTCFLIRFEYAFGDRQYSNIGIVGPVTYAFHADMEDLPPLDIYAAYAGWQTVHSEIYTLDAESQEPAVIADRTRLERHLRAEGFENIQPTLIGVFFGERIFVGEAEKEGQTGSLAGSLIDYLWYPRRREDRAIEPDLAYSIFKGRRLLKAFNQ